MGLTEPACPQMSATPQKSARPGTGLTILASLIVWLAVTSGQVLSAAEPDRNVTDRGQQVTRLLVDRCLECHSGNRPEGGLDLTRRAAALQGGDSGPAFQPGQHQQSLIWEKIHDGEMPPKHPLGADEVALIEGWIDQGAVWAQDPIDRLALSTDRRAGYDWWSLRPLAQPTPPEVGDPSQVTNPIDRFWLAGLHARGLSPSPPAAPQQLIRRLYLDLTGLPPEPEVVERFVRDPSETQYERLVDQLLASPRYGERWARHWLDVARYAESNGFERNEPRRSSYYYRDWVIRALNDDLPYDQFAAMQIAGDVLKPGSMEGAAAVGFLVAGVHNTVVGSSERMQKLARQDELEEIIGATGQAFFGLTVHCARCHDHKFDPITQVDYYRLAATLAGVYHGERQLLMDFDQQRLAAARQRETEQAERLQKIEQPARERVLAERRGRGQPADLPTPLCCWEFDQEAHDSVSGLRVELHRGAHLASGGLATGAEGFAVTLPVPWSLHEKTLEALVQLADLQQRGGAAISLQSADGSIFDALVFGERDAGQWMAGSNGFVRSQSFQGPVETEADRRPVRMTLVYHADGRIECYRDGVLYGQPYDAGELQSFEAEKSRLNFGLRHAPPSPDRLLRGQVYQAKLYDRALTADEVAAAAGATSNFVARDSLLAALDEPGRSDYLRVEDELNLLRSEIRRLEQGQRRDLHTVTPQPPAETRVLLRGDIGMAADVAVPGAVSALKALPAEFSLASDASDAERRLALVRWITDPANPLFPRVMVNRLWQHHFGMGIVDTPSDFGFNGGRPSHPELLDWLADQLRRNDMRLKPLHKLMVMSSAYRQASLPNPAAQKSDAQNRFLWRYSPRRMDAETLRDVMLAVSDQLNAAAGGPSFEDVVTEYNSGTNYYFPFDRDDPQISRRSIYRFSPRGGRSPLLDTFDCPDACSATPRRAVTTTPLQALTLWNDAFAFRMARGLAQRVERESGGPTSGTVAQQVNRAYWIVYGREPAEDETSVAEEFVGRRGLEALCRVLMNSNEFVFVR